MSRPSLRTEGARTAHLELAACREKPLDEHVQATRAASGVDVTRPGFGDAHGG